mmetsp:Transcript_32145/g.39569  ORF Transcript_32145/g.39569 Transcript_32145/m.39569 type:complete len:101 (+) Transcript_32145:508-810(+)
MASNAGFVGLRTSMDLGDWGENRMRYRTAEEEMSRQEKAHSMLVNVLRRNGVDDPADKVRFYASFSYRSHKDLSSEGIASAKWYPDQELRTKHKKNIQFA